MRTISHHKNIILLVVFIIAVFAVFFLLYKKSTTQRREVTAEAVTTLDPELLEVKAASKSIMDSHMALTSTNIIWFTNYYRTQYHLKPLTLAPQLRDSAYHKSLDMFKYQYFAHYRPTNKLGFDNFIDNQKYKFIKVGENLALGDFTTAKEIVDAWMRSPNHRGNILDAAYTEIGVSVDYGVMHQERSVLITQHLGMPVSSCQSVDAQINILIKNLNKQLMTLKEGIEENQTIDLITAYNALLKEREQFVTEYNNQVDAFDNCVSRGE